MLIEDDIQGISFVKAQNNTFMENTDKIPIYLVSLAQDVERRAALKKQFSRYYDQFIHIQAVDGRKMPAHEYFSKTLPFLKKHNRPMTPAEMGCTLSHIKVLKAFLKTNATHALILEDDIIGSDENIDAINDTITLIPQNSLLLCGLLYRCEVSAFRYGKLLESSMSLYQISKFSYPYAWGTYSYVVTRASAQIILESHSDYLKPADKYEAFFMHSGINLYLISQIRHPVDLTQSCIKSERVARSIQETFFQKLFAADSPKRIFNFFKLRFRLLITKLTHEKLPEN